MYRKDKEVSAGPRRGPAWSRGCRASSVVALSRRLASAMLRCCLWDEESAHREPASRECMTGIPIAPIDTGGTPALIPPQTLDWHVMQDPKDETKFCIVERYEQESSQQYHLNNPVSARARARARAPRGAVTVRRTGADIHSIGRYAVDRPNHCILNAADHGPPSGSMRRAYRLLTPT